MSSHRGSGSRPGEDRRGSPEERLLEVAPWPALAREVSQRAAAQSGASSREARASDEEDEDIPLPPLDTDEDDQEGDDGEADDLLPTLDDETGDPFDDAAASDLEMGVELDVDESEARGGDEPAEEGIDVGALDEGLVIRDDSESASEDRGEGGLLEEEDDLDAADDTRGEDDGGAEGMSEGEGEELSEADLPALDADEEGNYEGEDMMAELALSDASLPPWDALRWTAMEGAGATVPCSALAVGAGKVIAGGEVVLIVDDGAHAARRAGFEAGASSVAVTEEGALVAAIRGQLWVSDDDGGSASAVVGWRGGRGAVELATTPGRLWILSEGALWSLASMKGPAVQVRRGDVVHIAASGAVLVALTRAPSGPALTRLRSDDEGWQATTLTGVAQAIADDGSALLAAADGGRLVAIASKERLCVSRDGGVTFQVVDVPGAVALAFAGDDGQAPLLALLGRATEDVGYVVHVPADGPATTVAEVAAGPGVDAAEDDDAAFEATAMGWDSSREVAWIACRAGLIALERARKH